MVSKKGRLGRKTRKLRKEDMYLVHSDPLPIHLSIWQNFPTRRRNFLLRRREVPASRAPRRHRHRSTPAAAATRHPAAPARRPARAPSTCPAAMPQRRRAAAAATAAAAAAAGSLKAARLQVTTATAVMAAGSAGLQARAIEHTTYSNPIGNPVGL